MSNLNLFEASVEEHGIRLLRELVEEGQIAKETRRALNKWLAQYGLCVVLGRGDYLVGNLNPRPDAGTVVGYFPTQAEAVIAALNEAVRRAKDNQCG